MTDESDHECHGVDTVFDYEMRKRADCDDDDNPLKTRKSSRTRRMQLRRKKDNQKTFDKLAEIYLQNPYYLKTQQLSSILHIAVNGKFRNESTERIVQSREVPSRPQTRQKYASYDNHEIETKKTQSNFRIIKHYKKPHLMVYHPKLKMMDCSGEPTIELESRKHHVKQRVPSPQHRKRITAEMISRSKQESLIKIYRRTEDICFRKEESWSEESHERSEKNKSHSNFVSTNSTNTKTIWYVVNSKDEHVKKELQRLNWSENKTLSSNIYNLKWSFKEQIQDYKLLMSAIQSGHTGQRFYNHIKNNEMTNKLGLYKLFSRLCQTGCRPSSFMPRTYEPSENIDITNDFEFTLLRNIIKNHGKYFTQKKPNEVKTIRKLIKRKKTLKIRQQSLTDIIDKLQTFQRDETFVVNMPLLRQAITSLERRINVNFDDDIELQTTHPMEDPKTFKNLERFSKMPPPYEDYLKNTRSNIEEEFRVKDEMKSARKESPTKSSWWTPNFDCLYRIILYDEYFRSAYPQYTADGNLNIWIVKPCSSSRGQGISLTDKLEVMLQFKDRNKLVQKYIENPWIMDNERILSNNMSEETYKKHKLYNRKFDLRQWVLISSINPLRVYMFSQFYVKICSEHYVSHDLTRLSRHLSNYALNKNSFKNPSNSVMSEQQFQEVFTAFGQDFSKLKQNIRNIIVQTVKTGSESMEHIDGTFQLIGFDILLDQNANPWILEVNMSPACTERAEWMADMLSQMTSKMFRLVMPKSYFCEEQENSSDSYSWEPIIMMDKLEHTKNDKICITSTKFNVTKERRREKYFNEAQESKLIMLQRTIRHFLRAAKVHNT